MFRALNTFRLAAAACLLVPLMAQAAGLGRLTVQSALGQPLRAEVEVVSVQRGEQESLNARIAPPDAFRAAGIEFSSVMVNIRVAVERRDGRAVLRLTSTQPVSEPFIELLLELQWANGRLVREYTFLLDPVEYKAPKPVAVAPPPVVAAKPIPATPAPAKPAAPAQPKAVGSYEVKRGDTLSKVARENKAGDVTVNQMLVALYRANQGAFIHNNMYLMRSGHLLKIPDRAAAASIDPAEATRLVREQSVEFDEYRRGLGASVAAAPAKPAPPAEREAPGRIAPKPPEAAPKPQQKDQIKLSKAEASKPATTAGRAAAEDDKVALNRALKESQSRVADLEKQIGDLKKLIELKNQQLALIERKAGEKPAAAAPAPAPVAPKPAPEAAKPAAEPVKPAAETPKPAPEAAKAPATPPAAPKAPPATAKPKPPPPPAPEASLMDEFLENPVALGGLVGVLALLIGYGAWAWRRKKASQQGNEGFGSIATASAASAIAQEPSAPVAAAPQAIVAEPVAEEVDPIAEAEVYLAYGRDAQAEAILKDALAGDPDRVVVHAKLLEIYAQRKDKTAFEQTALKIKGLAGGAGPEWDKAMSLGRSIDPENGLYGSGPGAATPETATAASSAASPTLDFDIGGATSPGTTGASAAPALDFDIGATTSEQPAAEAFKPGDTVVLSAQDMQSTKMDFDINAVAPATPPAKAEAAAPAAPAAPAEPAGLDFDLDFELGESAPKPAAAPATDVSSLSLDIGAPGTPAPGASVDPKWQEVATKLDLAKAYQEMGDKSGARELLDEVMKEGDAAQQEEAKRVLAKLG